MAFTNPKLLSNCGVRAAATSCFTHSTHNLIGIFSSSVRFSSWYSFWIFMCAIARSNRLSLFGDHIVRVGLDVAQKQVNRIHAWRVITTVQDETYHRISTVKNVIRNATSCIGSPSNLEISISVRIASRYVPRPAFIFATLGVTGMESGNFLLRKNWDSKITFSHNLNHLSGLVRPALEPQSLALGRFAF